LDLLLFGDVPYNVPHLGVECNNFYAMLYQAQRKE